MARSDCVKLSDIEELMDEFKQTTTKLFFISDTLSSTFHKGTSLLSFDENTAMQAKGVGLLLDDILGECVKIEKKIRDICESRGEDRDGTPKPSAIIPDQIIETLKTMKYSWERFEGHCNELIAAGKEAIEN